MLALPLPHSSISGPFSVLLSSLSQQLNFTFDLYRPHGTGRLGSWGTRLENGTWLGMLGMVTNGMVEFVATPFSITLERLEKMKSRPEMRQIFAVNFMSFTCTPVKGCYALGSSIRKTLTAQPSMCQAAVNI